jgi:FkbH-like protein
MKRAGIKCVVWDLDNTLWQGTLLEGDDISLRPGVKDIILELDGRGILQSIASRNDYAPAWDKLTALGLEQYFLLPQIGWVDKSISMQAIADGLGIGIDTLALIDDQAFEREEVRHALPTVTTIDAAEIDNLLNLSALQPRFVTGESRLRRHMYQADMKRKQVESDFTGTRDEFLQTLNMCLTLRVATEPDLRRAEELTLRTHQLNTTGRTYSYEELAELIGSPHYRLLVAELDDRFGSSGTIGLALLQMERDVSLLKLFIMSCRVMSRGVGVIMLSYLLQSAKSSGVKVRAEFVPTDRNRIMYVTYKFNGFFEVGQHDEVILLEHSLEAIRPFPRGVTVRLPDDPAALLSSAGYASNSA